MIFLGIIFFAKQNLFYSNLENVTYEDIVNFLSRKNSIDQEVNGIIKTNSQYDDIDEGDIIKVDKERLYICNYQSLQVINTEKEIIEYNLHFENFYPMELMIYDDTIIVFGTQNEIANLIPGHNINYYNSECMIYLLNKNDLKTKRFLKFNNSYYLTSRVINDELYLVLNSYNIFNYESQSLIYPSYEDSLYGYNKLTLRDIYLYENGQNIYGMNLIVKINLNNNSLPMVKGLLGMESFVKLNQSHLIFVSYLYDKETTMMIHLFSVDNFKYLGQVELEGYLINQYAIDSTNEYLRVASYNQEENILYNIRIKDFKIMSQLDIAPKERIYAIRFQDDFCFISTFLYIDPFFIIDFSNPEEIVIVKENKLDFVNEYIQIINDKILTFGRFVDENKKSNGLIVALIDINNLDVINSFSIQDDFIDSDVKYNQRFLTLIENRIIFPMTDTKGQKMIILTLENDILKLDETFAYQNEYLLRGLIINERFYTISYNNIYIYDFNNYELIKKIEYNVIE